MEAGDSLEFYINGKKVVEHYPDPELTLVEYLRNNRILCNMERSPLCSVHGCAVTTVEGIGSTRNGLHEVQKRLAEAHGIQCGFCTPGMVMSMYTLLRNKKVTKENIEKALDGNLCRCTGYRPILQAFQSFEADMGCGLGEKCCKNKSTSDAPNEGSRVEGEYSPYDPSQEPIFPSELQLSDKFASQMARFEGRNISWIRPASLESLLDMTKKYPSAILTAGATQTAFVLRHRSTEGRAVVISLNNVPEMQRVEVTIAGIVLGAGVTVNEAIETLQSFTHEKPENKTRGRQAVLTLLKRFGSEQIRNMSTLGGSLYAYTANSDVLVGLVASGASLTLVDKDGNQHVQKIEDCFENGDYSAPKDGIILNINIPCNAEDEYILCGKQSTRRAMDRAIVNSGLRVKLEKTTNKVTKAVMCFGGIGKSVILARTTSKSMLGREWNDGLIEDICKNLSSELLEKTVDNKKEYRNTLAIGHVFKFYHSILEQQNGPTGECSLVEPCSSSPVTGIQVFEEVSPDQDPNDPVGRPIPQMWGKEMATGEALYYTDLPQRSDEKFIAMVWSNKAHARILNVDMSAALEMEGVCGFVDHRDTPGRNTMTDDNDFIFAVDEVTYAGQAICGIVADDEKKARKAAKAVKVEYEELPHIITISDAIEKESFFEDTDIDLFRGDFEDAFSKAEHTLEGTSRMSTQEHFYMETQFTLVVPTGESNEYNVYVAAQATNMMHDDVAAILGIPKNRIIVHVKRMGGGFGGKEGRTTTATVLAPAAIAAYKFRVPVRASLNREEDILTTSKRHPFLVHFKAGFNEDGKIQAVRQDFYHNGGAVLENSFFVGQTTLANADNSYYVPNYFGTSKCCKTNLPTPGAMRGFAQPQAIQACEDVIDTIADYLGVPAEQVREKNLYDTGYTNLTGLKIDEWEMKKLWSQLKEDANVEERRSLLNDFNSKSRWKKRGLAMIPIRFAIGIPIPFLNQSSALVLVYTDGSVMLAHGGTEMGQGLHTKMIQIASRVLKISTDKIYISETGSNTVPNSSVTGGSHGSDLNGPAVIDACNKIMDRLEPYKTANPSGAWNDWVMAAFLDKVPLSATGHMRFDDLKMAYDFKKRLGNNVRYYTYGVACSEVEIDCLTGEHVNLQTDMIMDVGRSLNPGIDIGQIEGGFTQGMGMCTMEEIVWSPEGKLLTRNPDSYKIPTVADIPRKMNVKIVKGGKHVKSVYSAKGIGEPSALMGTSVFFAIKDAIRAARAESGLKGPFRLDCPATVERIRMACADKLTKLVTKDDSSETIPSWRQ